MAKKTTTDAEPQEGGNVPAPDYAQFTCDGSLYLLGVPARGLSRDEWDALQPETRSLCVATGLYIIADNVPAQEG